MKIKAEKAARIMMKMKIKQITEETLQDLEKSPWFKNVGIQDTQTAKVVNSWDEAIKECSKIEWEILGNRATNSLTMNLFKADKNRYNMWNEIILLTQPYLYEIINRYVIPVKEKFDLPKIFVDCVRWDIRHLLMEAEYSDIVPPAYYSGLAYWYTVGHFPCGQEGDVKTGRIIVY